MRILVAGEVNPDLILQGYHQFPTLGTEVLVDDLSRTLGGSSAICAAGLAKLGHQVAFLGRVGQDVYGEFCVNSLKDLGVDTSLIIHDGSIKTGITVSISSHKDRALVTYLGSIAALTAEDVAAQLPRGFDHLHISSFFLQHELRPRLRDVFQKAHAAGMTTSLDTGYDPSEKWDGGIREALAEADVFLPNEVELEALSGSPDPEQALQRLANGRTLIVAKLGANGAAAFDGQRFVRVPACSVTPVDTTGAGDSFNAGFLHAWLAKKSVEESLRFACACGALSTRALGGTSSQATEADAVSMMSSVAAV